MAHHQRNNNTDHRGSLIVIDYRIKISCLTRAVFATTFDQFRLTNESSLHRILKCGSAYNEHCHQAQSDLFHDFHYQCLKSPGLVCRLDVSHHKGGCGFSKLSNYIYENSCFLLGCFYFHYHLPLQIKAVLSIKFMACIIHPSSVKHDKTKEAIQQLVTNYLC